MRFSIGRTFSVLGLLILLCAGPVQAVPVAYTDYTTFLGDLVMPANVLDFDSLSAGTIINDGDTVGGITFDYPDLASYGVSMMVSDAWDTTSPDNFLGTNDGDIFQDGDDFDLSFAAASAIGMYFITADEPGVQILDNDITLTAGGESVGLLASAGQTLPDASYAFFLGIIDVDPSNAFTDASITTHGGGGAFLYNVDDITTSAPVPEPATMLLLGSGLVGLAGLRRKIKK